MLRIIYSSSVGATIAVIFIAVITIWAELSPALKAALKTLSGHHWLTKSIAIVIVYILVSFLVHLFVRDPSVVKVRRSLYMLISTTVLAGIAILGFFVWHYLQ
ncbi:MAG: hypothetical protein A2941_01840 [Candidatus Yanofskybacteria bacterium RIFCSPLOWO2_01_FULL_49_17]|uniref:Uncharacterized protein n=1 Tax=Candidatus Yanofskybacteria bacterium RIFCSPLOWO2_01_FULL_49_17 TaxID=1802700 RepID=A0A1F8GQT5_9BACT|nr:MAG: hypothetical protein A2941_01840 [Candidatus Yanofskybacteria bacterium RIFCSPLOWO2_01_FULL_49_17]